MGVNFFDFDNDTDSDLYITNGCLNPQLTPNPNLLLENIGGEFEEKGFLSRTNDHSIGRGSVVFDYDQDGDLDLLVVNQNPYSDEDVDFTFIGTRLFRNETSTKNNWIKVKLVGRESESCGIGSRVEVHLPQKRMLREIYGGSSHESQNSTIAHFGLGEYASIDSVVVNWSSGNRQVLQDVIPNKTIEIIEDIAVGPAGATSTNLSLFPNAFSDYAIISYQLPNFISHRLAVLDADGKVMHVLKDGQEGRRGTFHWQNTSSLPPGVYLFVLSTPTATYVTKGIKN